MKILILTISLLPALVFASTISGIVSNKDNNIPIDGVIVSVKGTSLWARTNVSGRYTLRNVPAGRIVLSASCYAFRPGSDTLTIPSDDSSYVVNLRLPADKIRGAELWDLAARVLSPTALRDLRAYQDSLALLASRSSLLTLRLDTLYCVPGDQPGDTEMIASLSFRNNTAMPVSLLKNHPCMRRLTARVVDSSGDTVRAHEFFTDMMEEECHYDTTDIIVVPPHGESRYPESPIYLQSCRSLPEGMCSIRILYSYELPEYIWEASRFRPDQSIPYLRAVRGRFATENIKFLHGENPPPETPLHAPDH